MVLKNPKGVGPPKQFHVQTHVQRLWILYVIQKKGADSRTKPDSFSGLSEHQNTLATVAVDGFAESSPRDGRRPKHLAGFNCLSFPSSSAGGVEDGRLWEQGIAGVWLPCSTMKGGHNATLSSQMSDRDNDEPLLQFNTKKLSLKCSSCVHRLKGFS